MEEVTARISWLVGLGQGGASLSSARAPPPSLSLQLKPISLCAAGSWKRDSSLVPFSAHFVWFYPRSWKTFLSCKRCSKPPQNSKPIYPQLISSFLVSPWILVLISSVWSGSLSVSALGAVSTVSTFSFTCFTFYSSNLSTSSSQSTPRERCEQVSISLLPS